MTSLESNNESLSYSQNGLFESELSNLESHVQLNHVKKEIKKDSKVWEFESKWISKNWKYKVYAYTIEKHWTPSILKYQAVKRGFAKSKNEVLVTDKGWKEYEDSCRFSAWDKVYVKIEIKDQTKPQENSQAKPQAKTQKKPQTKPQEKPQTKPQEKPQRKPNSQEIEIQQSNIWKFEYKNISSDWKFEVYSYIVGQSTITQWEILTKAKKELNLRSNTRWLEITNSKWIQYKPREAFTVWEKIYLKIPVSIENNIQIIDGMKRKWWEYFWIDISHWNEEINLELFKNWNREKWNMRKSDTRWVSFVYIRATDWKIEDAKVKKHVNKLKEYNNDRTIKDNHEQIAVWFYHRMNSYDAKVQADTFLKTYKTYKDTAWWNNLVPMLDVEWDRIKNSTKKDVRNKALTWLQIVEENTWIVPGLYVTRSLYRDYFLNDNRFNKYLTRIAAYPESDKITKREIWTAKSIDFKKGTVDIWQSSQQIIKPTMYQSSQEWTVDWAYAIIIENKGKKNEKRYHDTDMDHTKDITKLFSKNNRSK